MFSKAHMGAVWWPVDFTEYDADGKETKQRVMFQFRPFTSAEKADRDRARYESMREGARTKATEATASAVAADSSLTSDQLSLIAIESLLSTLEKSIQAAESDREELAGRILDWRVKSVDKEPVPFDRELLADVLQEGRYYTPISQAFLDCCAGAVRKNSSPGLAGSQGQVRA